MIRRLTTKDTNLLRLAYSWDEGCPLWYKQMDAVFNTGEAGDLVAQLSDEHKAFIGIWDSQLTAVIVIEQHENGCYEGHLMAQRGTSPTLITSTATQLICDLHDHGLSEAFVWVAEKNLGVRRLCSTIGFNADGVVMYRGTYRGRLIKWLRYSIQRGQILMAQAA